MDETGRHDYRRCTADECERCQSLINNGEVIVCDGCNQPGDNDAPGGWERGIDGLLYCSHCVSRLNVETQ